MTARRTRVFRLASAACPVGYCLGDLCGQECCPWSQTWARQQISNMRTANPIENTGIIIRRNDGAFLGSCFVFRYPKVALTAAHVVSDLKPDQLVVALPGSRAAGALFSVREVSIHPKADLAVVEIDPPDERDITWTVNEVFDDMGYGLDVVTYGYPQHSAAGAMAPTPRLFKGYVQRFLEHKSHLGYTYVAAELSFSCPAGLSGSHVLNSNFSGRLYGVVTENIRTSTELDSVLEVDEGGQKYRESFHSIINYGLALWLPACCDWLNGIVPPLAPEEINRRATNQHLWNAEETAKTEES